MITKRKTLSTALLWMAAGIPWAGVYAMNKQIPSTGVSNNYHKSVTLLDILKKYDEHEFWKTKVDIFFKKYPELKEDKKFLSQLLIDVLYLPLYMHQRFDIFEYLLSLIKKPMDLSSDELNNFIGCLFREEFNKDEVLKKQCKKFFSFILNKADVLIYDYNNFGILWDKLDLEDQDVNIDEKIDMLESMLELDSKFPQCNFGVLEVFLFHAFHWKNERLLSAIIEAKDSRISNSEKMHRICKILGKRIGDFVGSRKKIKMLRSIYSTDSKHPDFDFKSNEIFVQTIYDYAFKRLSDIEIGSEEKQTIYTFINELNLPAKDLEYVNVPKEYAEKLIQNMSNCSDNTKYDNTIASLLFMNISENDIKSSDIIQNYINNMSGKEVLKFILLQKNRINEEKSYKESAFFNAIVDMLCDSERSNDQEKIDLWAMKEIMDTDNERHAQALRSEGVLGLFGEIKKYLYPVNKSRQDKLRLRINKIEKKPIESPNNDGHHSVINLKDVLANMEALETEKQNREEKIEETKEDHTTKKKISQQEEQKDQ